MDSKGRLFVGDRQNNRIQIFDQEGKHLAFWPQFSRPSGVFIDRNDLIYVADSESESVSKNHDGWRRGIRIGSVRELASGRQLIPDDVDEARLVRAIDEKDGGVCGHQSEGGCLTRI